MAQAYNDELVPKINAVLDQFTGDTIPQIHTALENTEEVVNEVGSAKAKKSFANCKEGTVEVLKAIEELMPRKRFWARESIVMTWRLTEWYMPVRSDRNIRERRYFPLIHRMR